MTLTSVIVRAFGSGTVITCFIGLLQLGFEYPTFRMRGESSHQIRHYRGYVLFVKYIMRYCYQTWYIGCIRKVSERPRSNV